MIENKIFDCQEIFRHACTFCECADMALDKLQHDTADIGFYTSPATINSAFACEVFLKTMLKCQGISIPKTHKLRELYDVLPDNLKEYVKRTVSGGYDILWTNLWGTDYLDNISNLFVESRYIYEYDWSEGVSKNINIGFLNCFREALREACCQMLFNKTWNEYKGSKNG